MSSKALTRRASYGPKSPVIGERGARTRQRLLDIALRQFADHGFHAALVDDIAREAGVSRATFYQYFDSREEVIRELLEECGAALLRVVRRLGPLSPTAAGYDNLHWWLGEWAYVYDKYATIFIEWAHIDGPRTELRPMVTRFVERYTASLAPQLERADLAGLDPAPTALALQMLIERFNYYRLTQSTGCSDQQLLETLAVCVQRLLFPETPASAYALVDEPAGGSGARVPLHLRRASAAEVDAAAIGSDFTSLSDAALRSVEQLIAGGSKVFAESGYRASSVDQILTVSGLSRRTFYKYFSNRLDLLDAISDRCARQVTDLAADFERLPAAADPHAALHEWCASVVAFAGGAGGVLRIWLEEPVSPRLEQSSRLALDTLIEAFSGVLSRRAGPTGFDPTAAAWLVLAVVERVPHQAVSTRYDVSGESLVDLMTALLARGLLGVAG